MAVIAVTEVAVAVAVAVVFAIVVQNQVISPATAPNRIHVVDPLVAQTKGLATMMPIKFNESRQKIFLVYNSQNIQENSLKTSNQKCHHHLLLLLLHHLDLLSSLLHFCFFLHTYN